MVVNHALDAALGSHSFVAISKDLTVSFYLALDAALQAPVFRLREEAFCASQSYLLGRGGHRDIAADRHDLSSYIYSCSIDDTVVASCRWITPHEAEYPLRTLVDPVFVDELDPDRRLEVSRAVVAPRLRGRQISEILMYFSCLWLLRNTSYKSYGSICVPKLAGFYEHFGAQRFTANPIAMPDRQTNQYVAVCGHLRESLDMLYSYLARLGWSLSHTPALPSDVPSVVATPVCEGVFRLSGASVDPPAFAFLLSRSRRVLYLSHVDAWSAELDERMAEILGGRPPDDVILARVSASDWADLQRLSRTLSGSRIHVPAAAAALPPIENVRWVPRSAEPAPMPGVPDLATCVQRDPAGGVIALYDARWRGLFGFEASTAIPAAATGNGPVGHRAAADSTRSSLTALAGLPGDTKIVGAGGWSSYPTLGMVLDEQLRASEARRPRISLVG